MRAKQNESGQQARPLSWRRRSQSGQSLVELALLTPLLLLMIIGIVEMGRYTYIAILVGNAARTGASWGAQTHITAANQAGIIAAADNDFKNNGLKTSNLQVTSSYSCGCDNGGTITVLSCATTCAIGAGNEVVSLKVTAAGTFNSLFNYPGIPKSLKLTSTATQRIGE
jgi:Flp pilus assembly protein TadG